MPDGVVATNVTTDGFDVSWAASPDAGTEYLYTATARDDAGNVSPPTPATPATATSGTARYRVLVDGAVAAETDDTHAHVAGLAAGSTYDLAVVAVDAAGNASARSPVSRCRPGPLGHAAAVGEDPRRAGHHAPRRAGAPEGRRHARHRAGGDRHLALPGRHDGEPAARSSGRSASTGSAARADVGHRRGRRLGDRVDDRGRRRQGARSRRSTAARRTAWSWSAPTTCPASSR